MLPAWDVAAWLYLTLGVLTAEYVRRQTGLRQDVVLSLADVMLATVGNLGYIGDLQVNGAVREPIDNDLCGVFGRDFATLDGRRIMLVAISNRQWRTTGLAAKLDIIGMLMDVDMTTDAALARGGTAQRLGFQRHQALGSKADFFTQHAVVSRLLQQRAKGDLYRSVIPVVLGSELRVAAQSYPAPLR